VTQEHIFLNHYNIITSLEIKFFIHVILFIFVKHILGKKVVVRIDSKKKTVDGVRGIFFEVETEVELRNKLSKNM